MRKFFPKYLAKEGVLIYKCWIVLLEIFPSISNDRYQNEVVECMELESDYNDSRNKIIASIYNAW